jgi:hypothetical protein
LETQSRSVAQAALESLSSCLSLLSAALQATIPATFLYEFSFSKPTSSVDLLHMVLTNHSQKNNNFFKNQKKFQKQKY